MQLPLRRVFDEKRRLLLPVAAALAINVLLYVGVVYPMSARLSATEARAQAAQQAQLAAEREDAAARSAVQGRERTDTALKAFYSDVLPPTLAQARQATFLRLTQLAEAHNLEPSRRNTNVEPAKGKTVERMRATMSLQGSYEDIRRFIHEVESGEDFIVIDSVALRQGVDTGGPLTLDLTLSTYYRARPGGA
jgi:Tfp pilus assembly protein PilO